VIAVPSNGGPEGKNLPAEWAPQESNPHRSPSKQDSPQDKGDDEDLIGMHQPLRGETNAAHDRYEAEQHQKAEGVPPSEFIPSFLVVAQTVFIVCAELKTIEPQRRLVGESLP
jgi:hypothetical protein